jgi:hypothetical protein
MCFIPPDVIIYIMLHIIILYWRCKYLNCYRTYLIIGLILVINELLYDNNIIGFIKYNTF